MTDTFEPSDFMPRAIVAAVPGAASFGDDPPVAIDRIAGSMDAGEVVLVDARGDRDAGLAAVRALAGLPMLVIAHQDDARAFRRAGATHFLGDPRDEAAIRDALIFAGGAPREERRDAAPVAALLAVNRVDATQAILVSLSRFDIVNAAYGRPAGDALIATAEARIRAACGAYGAQVARFDGATFVVALSVDAAAAAEATARIGAALARPFPIGDATAVIGARFAVAAREAGDDAAALLARAAEALAAVQASEGATVHIAGPARAAPIATLAADLHRAIDRDEIAILYQPQVRIVDDRIIGVEALARWDHPTLGSLGAETLFAAAGRADLGLALSDHIQRIVLAHVVAWPAVLGALRVSLNVTAADIARLDFAALFLARVAESGLPTTRVTVEITETALIADLDAAAAMLATLREAGVRVALDDFGTGYSGLSYLKALPLDVLKIDQSLIRDVVESPRAHAVVRGVVAMATALELAVVAEGVETPTQRALLAGDGCAVYQGFLCAGPLTTEALVELVETWTCCTA